MLQDMKNAGDIRLTCSAQVFRCPSMLGLGACAAAARSVVAGNPQSGWEVKITKHS